MTHILLHSRRLAAATGLVCLAAGATIGAAGAAPDGPAACEIVAQRQGASLQLTALARAERAVTGSYTFEVASTRGGNTRIRQGGDFTAGPGRPATLGTLGLDAGAIYDATLELKVGGRTMACTERVGGRS